MNSPNIQRGDSRPAVAVLVWMAALLFAWGIGRLTVVMPFVAVLCAVIPIALMLFFKNPVVLILIYFVAMYDGGGILPLDTLFQIPGIGRPTDLFGAMLFGYLVLLLCMRREQRTILQRNIFYRPLMIMLIYTVVVLIYTVVHWNEDPLLAFRIARRFFVYGIPLVMFFIIKDKSAWRWIERICLLLIYLAFVVSIADAALGLDWVDNVREGSAQRMGIIKAYTQVKALAVFFLGRYVWLYAHEPTRKNFLMMSSIAGTFLVYLFRGFMAGTAAGVFAITLLMLSFARRRALRMLFGGGILVVLLAIMTATVLTDGSLNEMSDQFFGRYLGDIGEMGEAISGQAAWHESTFAYRMEQAREKLPLFRQNPWFGIGFLSPMGRPAWKLYLGGEMPLGDIDSGWVDILMRLGSIGAVVVAYFYSTVMYKLIRTLKYWRRTSGSFCLDDQAWMMGTFALMVQILVGLISGAYITHVGFVLALMIGLTRCMQIWEEQRNVQRSGDGEQRSGGQ